MIASTNPKYKEINLNIYWYFSDVTHVLFGFVSTHIIYIQNYNRTKIINECM